MKKAFAIFLLIVFGGGVVFCAFMAIDASRRASDTVGIAHEAFDEINKLRSEQGVPQLTWDTELEKLAIAHSQYMNDTGKFEHSNYSFSYAENILQGTGGFPSGNSVVTPWRTSPGHYMNMISPDMSWGAIGIVGDYATFMGR
jgi:uncharacterized protein YkwD